MILKVTGRSHWLIVNLNNLIPESQFGFRKGRGCMDNLFTLMATIKIHFNNKGSVVNAALVDC